MRTALASIVLLVTAVACSKPESPTLVPEKAVVTSLSPQGFELDVRLAATNPNKIALSVRSLTGKVTVDGKHDLGTVTTDQALTLPAGKTTTLAVPLALKWNDLPTLIALGVSDRAVPYQVDGTVNLGGDMLNVNVPFRLQGTITHEQILRATSRSIPGLHLP